jgi:hypothetical protein
MIRRAGYARRAGNTRSRADRRAISVPLRAVTRGQPRPLTTGLRPRSTPQRDKIPAIPKLTARVRFPSPAPRSRASLHGLPLSALRASLAPDSASQRALPPSTPEDLLRFARFRARPLPIYRAGRWSPPRAVLASGSGCSSRGLCPSSRSCRPLSTSTRRVLVGRGRGQLPV